MNNAGAWADVRCPIGKVPLRAQIVRNSLESKVGGYNVYQDFSIFAPGWKNDVFPSGKFCDAKNGWVV
jgi:hypothetical protein